MLIRDMLEVDLDMVCKIEEETFSDPWSKTSFLKSISDANNHYLVAIIDSKLVGYCGYYGVSGEGYIYNVAVDKDYRRQGIGYQMLVELIKKAEARGITALTLEVRQSNMAAIHLYKRLGFSQEGIRKDFYTKPIEDAIIMWRNPIQ
ncbi:MAG: ribosomal protein S18-alanine N-acetyltransferase [Clostridiales bacterium]|mgnify:CR=1 FL=1|nr:ribosomal protein S18-alanine N-acetyltransferase [Clostridiales bacterium]